MKMKYTNGEITVHWDPDKCIHSGICASGMPHVFKPKERPWVQIQNASSDEIVAHVQKCPSGALSISRNQDNKEI